MATFTVSEVTAVEILDTKARPTVEAIVTTKGGAKGYGAAPTGTTVGEGEPFILKDDDKSRYNGNGKLKAVAMAKKLGAELIGMDVRNQNEIDEKMKKLDGTDDLHNIGGNVIGSLSISVTKSAAAQLNVPVYEYLARLFGNEITKVPIPTCNSINGGPGLSVSEYIFVPHGTKEPAEAVEWLRKLHIKVGEMIREATGAAPKIGGSDGYVAPYANPKDVIELMHKAVEALNLSGKVAFAIDGAASDFCDKATNTYEFCGQKNMSAKYVIDFYDDLTRNYPMAFIEDPLDERAWDDWVELRKKIRSRTLIIGDDLTVTNPKLLKKAIAMGAIDGFVLKPNQAGTMSDVMECVAIAKEHALEILPSGRSGGVNDDIVRHVSIACGAKMQKNGAPVGVRIEALNIIMRVSEEEEVPLASVEKTLRFFTSKHGHTHSD